MLMIARSGSTGGAGSRRLGELVEAVLLRVSRSEEIVHPLEAVLQLFASELVQADCGRLGSAHVLHGSLVDGRDGAEGTADRAASGSHVGIRLGSVRQV